MTSPGTAITLLLYTVGHLACFLNNGRLVPVTIEIQLYQRVSAIKGMRAYHDAAALVTITVCRGTVNLGLPLGRETVKMGFARYY